MTAEVVLVQKPSIEFSTLLSLMFQALGYSPATAADSISRKLTDAERFISCLAAMRDQSAPAGLPPNLLSHVSFSVLIACDERDLLAILEPASGMHFVTAPTIRPGVSLVVLTGTLGEWRDGARSGARQGALPAVHECWTKIVSLFDKNGLSSLWNDFNRKSHGNTFYLEDKRK